MASVQEPNLSCMGRAMCIHSGLGMCDRTIEFRQCVAGLSQASTSVTRRHHEIPVNRSAFHNSAAEIASGIHRTSATLSELTKLVRKQGLFDDPTEKINNMIVRIKEDIADLNFKCDAAQQYVENSKKQHTMPNQAANHSLNVVSSLKTELMHATKGFKSALELRSTKMKDQQEKKFQLAGPRMISPLHQTRTPEKPTGSKPMALPSPYQQLNPYSADDHSNSHQLQLPPQSQQQQQMLLIQPPIQYQYYEQRQEAVDEVTKTIGELGQLFKRLSTMISEQQELVERIDEDIESTVATSDLAHQTLLKTYDSVSNNKTFAMKIIGILLMFIIFFVLFLM